jgi:hypothetical protein
MAKPATGMPFTPVSGVSSMTATKTKTATKDVIEKKTRRPEACEFIFLGMCVVPYSVSRYRYPCTDKEDKPKHEPSAYQVFVKANMKAWNEANPGQSKEAMSQVLTPPFSCFSTLVSF